MIQDFLEKNQQPKYRIQQFNQAFYQQGISSYDQLTGWPKSLREAIKQEVPFMSLKEVSIQVSKQKDTIKVAFQRQDGKIIETVLMRHQDGRNTVCVSCMVGCPVNCSFCATGKLGFSGNLSATEIIDQVLFFQRFLVPQQASVTNVVFMGMGEPMLNLAAVQEALQIMTDKNKLGLGQRRMTISTSGYVPQLKKLIKDGFRGRVAISLHAPNQSLREQLMPVAKIYSLDLLMTVLDEYVAFTNKRVSYEYILIDGVTDQPRHANELIGLFNHRLAHINLIPYNAIKGVDFKRSSKKNIHRFLQMLQNRGVPASIRVTMGDDIDAACGQLASKIGNSQK